MVLRQLDSHRQKNEVEPLPYIQKCKTSKRIKELIAKIIKFLEENIGQKPHDLGFTIDFWNRIPKT